MSTKALLLLCLLLLSPSLRAADGVVRGVITSDNGVALPFAYITVEGKRYATQADKHGVYTLHLPAGEYTLAATMVGYKPATHTVIVDTEQVVDFVLEEDLINLSQVTVTGTRTPRTLAATPVVTQVITADDIKKLDATNVQDVLAAELPGLEFTYSMDQQVTLTIQGLGGMAILLLVDGERLAGETLDNTDFQRLPTADIERIEIIKGAASALYGSNSVGAVVNIITKRAADGWQADVNAHLGAHSAQRYGLTAGVKEGRWNSLTTVQTDRISTYEIDDRVGDNTTTIYGNRQWNIKEKLSYEVDKNNLLTARAGYYFHQRDYSSYKKNRARDFSGGLRWESHLSARSRLDIAYTFDRYDKSDFYADIGMDFLSYKNIQHSLRALYTHELGHGITWIIGGDGMNDYLMSYQFDNGGSHTQWTADLFTQGEWQITPHWNVVVGVRGDYLSKAGWQVSPKVAAQYTVGDVCLRASYARGFRAPTLKEMYMNFDMSSIFYIYGNPSLTAEHSHSFVLSGEYTHKRYSVSATAYYNIMSNEITTLWDSTKTTDLANGSMVYENIAGRALLGVDLSLTARYPCGIGATLSYNYFHEFPREGEYNLSATRPHSVVAKVDYRKTVKNYEFDLILTGRVLSGVSYYTWSDDYRTADVRTSSRAYSLWRIALSQRFLRAYTVLLAVDNLFNYRPREFEYNSPVTTGTTVSATIAIDIEKIFNK